MGNLGSGKYSLQTSSESWAFRGYYTLTGQRNGPSRANLGLIIFHKLRKNTLTYDKEGYIIELAQTKEALKVKAAAYLRVSTADQAGDDRYGLPAQRGAIEAYAAAQGIDVGGWYVDEISGASKPAERPGLQQLMAAAQGGTFTVVLVAKMDRVARDLYVSLFVEKELLLYGVEIISVTEPVAGRDPMQVAFRQMMACFAELEKSMITVRMSGGRRQKAQGGGYAGGGPALGYKAARGKKVLELDREKALTVKRVFELKEERPDYTLQGLADQLNKEGHSTAQGKKFKPMQVKRILDRKDFYSGVYSYTGVESEGLHQAII